MRIGIDTLSVKEQSGGIRTYLTLLLRALAKVDVNKEHDYILFVAPYNRRLFQDLGSGFSLVTVPLLTNGRAYRFAFEQIFLPWYAMKYRLDVMFCPTNLPLLFPQCGSVTMVHDLNYRFIPKLLDAKRVRFYQTMFSSLIRRSDYIIVPSTFTREALIQATGVSSSKIRVIYEGVVANSEPKSPLPIGKDMIILFVSTLHPHKNADKLLRAYARIASKVTHKLVFVGADPGGQLHKLRELATDLGIANQVAFQGYVENTEPYFNKAAVFVYPSYHEGFGLPPLEAMARGVPVVASNMAAIPEVVGNGGLLVHPDDIESMAAAIYKVLSDEPFRQRLIQAGYRRVAEFSWEKTAVQTLEVFQEARTKRLSIRGLKKP